MSAPKANETGTCSVFRNHPCRLAHGRWHLQHDVAAGNVAGDGEGARIQGLDADDYAHEGCHTDEDHVFVVLQGEAEFPIR